VESRRIANVNTGEVQQISGHYKPTFTPDAALAEAVNEPFAHLETIDLDEDSVTDQPLVQKPIERLPAPAIVENKIEEKVKPVLANIEEDKPVTEVEQEIDEEEESTPRKRSYKTLIFLILFVLLAGGGYYGYQFWGEILPMQSQKVSVDSTKSAAKDTALLHSDSAKVIHSAANAITESQDSIITTEMMEAGSRLTRIALKYYGNKVFWVYLYKANTYVISNPNHVTAGTVIEIPNAKIYDIDASNPASIAKAKALESEIQRQFE
jgi:hypothetical protein